MANYLVLYFNESSPVTSPLVVISFCNFLMPEKKTHFLLWQVRLQTQARPEPGKSLMYTGTWDCFKKIVKHEGVKGLYKG